MHVIVTDLFRKNCRSDRTGEQVKSNKREHAMMSVTVHANEVALTEAHVCLERQGHGGPGVGVCSGPAAADVGQPYEAAEICDLGRVVDVPQRDGGVQRVVVDEDSKGSKWR